MRTLFFAPLGLFLLLVAAYEVYATILHARARTGPVSELINRTIWIASRGVAFKLARTRRHRLLNSVGPILLPFLIVALIILLVAGFALIYYPQMPAQFNIHQDANASAFTESLYFSGITLTTVGYGDVAPRTFSMRALALVESASGFTLISLSITYLLTVYSALERKRAVALSFYHQAEEGANVAGFIAHHFVGGRFVGLETTLRQATRDIQGLLEAHVEHPVIHYFHPVEVYKSLPRMLFLVLETCAVIRSCLSTKEYAEMRNHPEVRNLEASARHVLGELVASLALERREKQRDDIAPEDTRRWRRRYRETMQKLKEAGIETRADAAAGWEDYRAQREDWEAQLRRFASFLGYDWDEITGDRDLEYAADEEMEEPKVKK